MPNNVVSIKTIKHEDKRNLSNKSEVKVERQHSQTVGLYDYHQKH